ncbi:DUF4230 domain-containing protein [Cytophagaceae bacterium DM2B3-1]|uniref:DUF4230 domain-containing protein n=1 Tax=Xanthocytophaga flava TaxID=3048013 RepID=A0ABT7CPZ0_9BACT|nr:DUF4230 domain-containing protein [Xanthocytophaga flavus]MDJ1495808.1 DUF4230 domain-containing protein [Xanthocytophaga flavus]
MIRILSRLLVLILIIAGSIAIYIKFFYHPELPPAETQISHTTVLQEINRIGKLELVRYNFKDILEYEKKRELIENKAIKEWIPLTIPLENAKVVLIVKGEAVGCIDLTKIKGSDLVTEGDTLIAFLPEPELCYYRINHDQSKVYDVKNVDEQAVMINEAYKKAEVQIKQSALDMGILEQTRTNASRILQPLLEKSSGKKVFIRYRLKGRFNELGR